MIKKLMTFLMMGLVLYNGFILADDQNADSCSFDDVQAAVNNCINTGGGSVNIPACSETDWGENRMDIDTDIPLKILGHGIDITNFAGSGNYMFKIYKDGLTEIGGFTVDLKGTGDLAVGLENPGKNTHTLIHDIKALNSRGSPFSICQSAYKPVVMYNLDIRNSKTYGIYVYGPGYLWDYSIPEPNWGVKNPNACFIEDSYFYQNGGHVISGFTGSRIVVRHNIFDDMLDTGLDGHGWGYGQSCGQQNSDPRFHANNYGAYQFEIYNNTWTNTPTTFCMRIRSGTGIVTDNICDAPETLRLVVEAKYRSGYDPDETTGTDSNIYTCIHPHISASDNRPITGANWQIFWKKAGSTGGTWSPGETYYPFYSAQSDCQVSVDALREFWEVIQDDKEIYGSDGKLDKAPVAYNIPHQWWIWNNDNSGVPYAEEDIGCLTEGKSYFLRAPQAGDPVESYTKYPYPHPLAAQVQTCSEKGGTDCCGINENCEGTDLGTTSDCLTICCNGTCTAPTCLSLGYDCCDSCETGTEHHEYYGDCGVEQVCCEACAAQSNCTSGADIDPQDNSVSIDELIVFIGEWKTGSVTIAQVLEAIGEWKSGC